MAAPKIYKYSDANAPVLSGTRGSLVALLKACLVDGYQDKPAAGWTMPFVSADAQVAVFRNNPATGTGFFLRVDDKTTSGANITSFKGYEIMADIDNGSGGFYASTPPYILKSWWANTTAVCWIVFATDRCFYFFSWLDTVTTGTPNKNNYMDGFFFGDFPSISPTDAFNCCLALAWQGNGNSGYGFTHIWSDTGNYASDVANANIFIPRPLSGIVNPFKSLQRSGGGPHNPGGMLGYSSGAYIEGNRLVIARPFLSENANYTMRGRLPGLYYPCASQPYEPFVIITDGSKQFMALSGGNPGYGAYRWCFLLDLTATFED